MNPTVRLGALHGAQRAGNGPPAKCDATAAWKKEYGEHPLKGFAGHERGDTAELVAVLLRLGNDGSATPPTDAAALAHSLIRAGRTPLYSYWVTIPVHRLRQDQS